MKPSERGNGYNRDRPTRVPDAERETVDQVWQKWHCGSRCLADTEQDTGAMLQKNRSREMNHRRRWQKQEEIRMKNEVTWRSADPLISERGVI